MYAERRLRWHGALALAGMILLALVVPASTRHEAAAQAACGADSATTGISGRVTDAVSATPIAGALVDRIGYSAAQEVAVEAAATGAGVRRVVIERGLLTAEDFDEMVSAESVTKLGSPLRKEKRNS